MTMRPHAGGHSQQAVEGACGTCQRLRWFLMVAGALIAGIYMQPQWAEALARMVPSPMTIGAAICMAGAAIFGLRLRAFLRG